MKRLVIGILAHVDAGKTTLGEALLYRAGGLAKLGRVDHGDAFLDTDRLERARGITIFSKQAVLTRGDVTLTLLDTPGHVDFSAEMERALQMLDYAVVVVGGSSGVQSHTETLWRLLAQHKIPTFLFLNKMDLPGADAGALLAALGRQLGDGCVDFGDSRGLAEHLALCDETLLEEFLATGTVQTETVTGAIAARRVFPCYFGSALKLDGVAELLDGLFTYTRAPAPAAEFGAKVFKITRDDQGTRLTHLKITGGSLRVKEVVTGLDRAGEPWSEKVNGLRIYSGSKFKAVEEAEGGTLCAVTGLTSTYPGQGLGTQGEGMPPLLHPVLRYRVELPPDVTPHRALTALRILEEEDPQLHVSWNQRLQEIGVALMGQVQLEVLTGLLQARFQLDLSFGQGSIVYEETIEDTVEGVGHFEPLRHYAEVHLLLTPGPLGSGLHFDSVCSEDVLSGHWQRLILTHLGEKVHLGALTGSPITDMTITLVSGRAHEKHTEGGDFREATYRAVRQGLRQAVPVLLEPFYEYRLTVPTGLVGRAMSDLQRRGCTFQQEEGEEGFSLLTGSAPVAALGDYAMEVVGYSHGKGRLNCVPRGYRPCHNTEEVVAALGYDCDGDTEHTADSVFCSHGVGVGVRWDKVPEKMHLPSVLPKKVPEEGPPDRGAILRRAPAYCAALAEDKELLKIYERTYGPIKRDVRGAFRPATKESAPQDPAPAVGSSTAPAGPEYLLVDGYNVIFAWDDLKAIAQDDLDAARSRLIHILCNYQGFRQCKVILVFDAYRVKGNPGEVEEFRNISVVYTKEAETADAYIEKVSHQLGGTHRVRVVTSDGLEQLIILGNGALRVPSRIFQQEVDEIEKAIRSYF